MKILNLPKPNLNNLKIMNCDEPIDNKLLTIPSIKCCFSTSNTTLFCGGTGSGKSTLLINLLKNVLNKCYNDIILCMPENSFNSINEKNNIFKKYLDNNNIYHNLNEEIINEIYNKIVDNANNGDTTLWIIDDFGNILKQKKIKLILESVFLKNRHLKCSLFVLTQNYYQLPKNLREITDNVILFNTSKSMNEKFFKEVFDFKEEDFKKLIKLLKTRHDYFIINTKYKRIFYNWDEIIFED